MNEQEKFDDLLRSKLSEERDFPFDETNWDKAEGMIERSEKRRRYGLIAGIFFVGVIAGAALMLPFIHSINVSSTTQIATLQQSTKNNVATNQNQDKTVVSSNTTATSSNNASIQQPAKQIVENNSAVTNNAPANPRPIASVNGTTPKFGNITVAQSGGNTSNTKSIKQHKHAAIDSTQQYSYVRPVSKKNKKKTAITSYATNNNTTVNRPGNQTNIPATGNNTLQPNNVNKPVEQNTTPTTQTANAVTQPDTSNKTQSVATVTNPVKTNDSGKSVTPPNNNTPTQQPEQPAKYTHTLLSIDAGAGYSLGWKKEGATQGSGLSPVLGFSVTHYFNTNISAHIGLQYNSLTNVNTLYSASTSQYDFGATNNVTSVTLKTLYYAALPIQFQYHFSSNDVIGIGANMLYLVNSNSNVVSYNQNYFGTSGYTSVNKTGYMDGINTWDAQLTLAYRRKISRFTISVEGYYGLLDIENNSFFNNNVFERNSGLRTILSFDIIK